MSAGSSSSSSEGFALFDRYAHRLRKAPTPTHAHSASLHSPVRARSQQSSPHRSPQHTRASSQSLGLPPLSAPFSPSSSVAASHSSPSSTHSSPSMKHTRTLMRAEKPRPRATGIRWYELTSRFDVSKQLDPKTAEEDMQWRQRLIRNKATDDLKALESTLLLLLDRPSHPLHAFCQHFIRAFNTHYAPLLSLSSRQSSDLLYYAVTEVDHFCTCLANLIMSLYPELYSREGVEMAKLTVFESVCPAVYSVLFSIYKRKNYYKDAEMAAKISSLQGVAVGELGVSEALRLDGTMPSAAPTITPTAATSVTAAAGGGEGESRSDAADSAKAGITTAESPSPIANRSGGSSSGATPSSSSSSRLSPSTSSPSSQQQRLLASLAPPVINTSPAHSLPPPLHPHHTPSSAPSSPLPVADAAPSTPTSGQPFTPLSSSPSAHAQPSNGRVKAKRTAVTRLKTMTSFDREALTQGERAHAIAESLSSLNQTAENAEGAVQGAEDEQEDDQPEGETQAGEGAHSPSATPDLVSPTTQPAAAEDVPAAASAEDAPARVSSLSAALKQLKITEGVTAEREEPPLPYNPHTLVSPLTSTSSSPVLTSSTNSPVVSTALPSASLTSPTTSTPTASTAPHYPYHEAVLLFRRLSSARTPRAKLSVFQLLSTQICDCVDNYYKRTQQPRPAASQLSINADDLLSILSFILIKSRLPSLVSEVAFIEDFVSESLRISQLGYFLAVFQASIELISNLRGSQEEQRRATAAAATAAAAAAVSVSKEEEEAAEAATETEANGKMASSLPQASPPALMSAVTSASLPHQHSSPSSLLTHSVSLTSLTSSSSASSATSAATGETGGGGGGEEESSAVLHADMTSLLADASQFNSYHFAVPTPEEDRRGSNGITVGEGRGSSGPGTASTAADARGGAAAGAAGSGEVKDTPSSSPSVLEDKKKKRTGWLRRK